MSIDAANPGEVMQDQVPPTETPATTEAPARAETPTTPWQRASEGGDAQPPAEPTGKSGGWRERAAAWLRAHAGGLPEAFTRPEALAQTLLYALEAPVTTTGDAGLVRKVVRGWSWVALVIGAVCDYVKWSHARIFRAIGFWVGSLATGTLLAQVPLVGLLVPHMFNVTSW
jgi:hypothetical protein